MLPEPTAQDWIELTSERLDVSRVISWLAVPDAGGIDLFLGITRNDHNAAGRELLALSYEAYPEMAVQRLHALAAEARRQWPIARLAMLHRVGRVNLAEASVLVAVACPHRAEAFAACRWLIDTLKADVPIWKQEIWADGDATWVHR